MSVTSTSLNEDTLTLTLVAELAAPVEEVWQLWADPRKLERWWGPPGFPATFDKHEFRPGGRSAYFMTGPDGERYHGWWEVAAVNAPASLEFRDGFSDPAGNPDGRMPVTTGRVTLTPLGAGTRLELLSRFASREDMRRLSAMGMREGLQQAVSQMDGLLAAG